MSDILGTWNIRIATPIGQIHATLTFADDDGRIAGVAQSKDEDAPLHDLVIEARGDEQHATWTQSITRPLRLNLAFDVIVDGDTLSGTSRAGRLPQSPVAGERLVS